MRKTFLTAALTFAAALATAPAAPAAIAPTGADYVPGELLVRFAGERERLIELPPTVGVGEAESALRSNPRVAYAVPDYLARTSAVPNDKGLHGEPGGWQKTQWNFLPCGSLCGQSATPLPFQARGGLNAPDAWSVLKSRGAAGAKGVKVAVLDTGVAYLTKKPKFRKSPDLDRRRFVRGFDFVDKNKMPLDRDGHGTHVASTIAERTGNRFALTGLAYKARIIPVRVLDELGFGRARDIARGVRFAAKRGAKVINMSFEFSGAVNSCAKIPTICSAIRFAARRGAVVVSAAGNQNGQPVALPAGAPHVIGVGRVTKDGCLAEGSRTGAGLDLVAPGGGTPLLATCGADDFFFARNAQISQLTLRGGSLRAFGYPRGYEGTSMAAAHVSGVAAMVIASRVVGRSPAAVECQLKGTARNQRGQLGQPYDPLLFGAGLVDARAAVTARAAGC
jgi:serine protease